MAARRFVIRRLRKDPEIPFVSIDTNVVMAGLIAAHFPNLTRTVRLYFLQQPMLACVSTDDFTAEIFIHSLLNHPSTPPEVLRFIIGHELIHLVVPGETIDGKHTSHPPAFWEMEKALFPERHLCWGWVRMNFRARIRFDMKEEGTYVKQGWKRAWGAPTCSWENVVQLGIVGQGGGIDPAEQ